MNLIKSCKSSWQVLSTRNSFRTISAVAVVAFAAICLAASPAQAQWRNINSNTPSAVRFITNSQNRLIGGRISSQVEVWASTNSGANWSRTGTVASGGNYGDCCFLSDGGSLVYCAFRELVGSSWNIRVCRSTDGGNTWVYDSTVASTTDGRFLGAPALWFSGDGTVQCYYDDEETPAQQGYAGSQWISMKAKPKFAFGSGWTQYGGVASRPSNASVYARDGMSSVVNIGGSNMMLVCEGVDPSNTARNCLFSIMSYNNGQTWDYNSRQRIWAPFKNGVQFNAYAPCAIRVGGGPVGVSFCTDDDFASPSSDSAAPQNRNAHAKYIVTMSTFQQWGNLATIDASANTMYVPGLYEISSNVLISTVDMFGYQRVNRLN